MPAIEIKKTLPPQYNEIEFNWNSFEDGVVNIDIRQIPTALAQLIAQDLKEQRSLNAVQAFLLEASVTPIPSHFSQIEGVSFNWAKKIMEGMVYATRGYNEASGYKDKKIQNIFTLTFLERLKEIDSSPLASRKFQKLSRDVFSGVLQVPPFFECTMPNTLSLQTRQWTTALCLIQTALSD